jgi:hypothetical protein
MDVDFEGLYRLYAAVYQLGIEDSVMPSHVSGIRERREVMREAREWVLSDEDYMFSFIDCCDQLQLDTEKERAEVMRRWSTAPPERKRLPACNSREELIRLALSTRGEVQRSELMCSASLKAAQFDEVLRGMTDVEEFVKPVLDRRTGKPKAKRTMRFYRLARKASAFRSGMDSAKL